MRPLDHHVGVLVDCRLPGPRLRRVARPGFGAIDRDQGRASHAVPAASHATRPGLLPGHGGCGLRPPAGTAKTRREQPTQACTKNHLHNGAQRCRCPGGDAGAGARPGAVIGRRGREAGRQAILTQGQLPPGDMAAAGKWQPRSVRKRDRHQVPLAGRMRESARPVFPKLRSRSETSNRFLEMIYDILPEWWSGAS